MVKMGTTGIREEGGSRSRPSLVAGAKILGS